MDYCCVSTVLVVVVAVVVVIVGVVGYFCCFIFVVVGVVLPAWARAKGKYLFCLRLWCDEDVEYVVVGYPRPA